MSEKLSPSLPNPQSLIPVDPAIEKYQHSLMERTNHPILIEMEAYAKENHFPIVDRLVGAFLEIQAKMINASRVFEFGSGFGYSAYWFARAVGVSGKVICTDGDLNNAEKAEGYLRSAGLWNRVIFKTGFAQSIFTETAGEFDICYNDADKGDYPQIWQMARERIRPGGLYIADNVLWHGRVAVERYKDIVPGWTEAIMAHNRMIFADSEFDAFINPTRDGVLIARKKND